MVIFVFYKYKIVNNTLYLYVNDKCEMGSFFGTGKSSLIDKVKEYIKNKKINFKGSKVVFLLSGLLIGSIYLNNSLNKPSYDVYSGNKYVSNVIVSKSTDDKKVDEEIGKVIDSVIVNEEQKDNTINKEIVINTKPNNNAQTNNSFIISENNVSNNVVVNETLATSKNNIYSNSSNVIINSESENKQAESIKENIQNEKIITVKRSNGEVINISLEEYLIGVVGTEMPASFNSEALKAQAVASRTYTMKLLNSNRVITDSVTTQTYKNNNELRNLWGSSYNTYYSKVKAAVDATKGLYMTYNGEIIDAVYHSTSNGYTEDSINVWGNNIPYLKIVTSPWDTSASSFSRTVDISFLELSNKLGFEFNNNIILEIISKDESNRVLNIKVGEKVYKGTDFRNLLGLRSTDFDITINENIVTFTTRGYGHGVGMSQYGANGMANSGYKYEEILKHYYTGISITK